MVYIVDNVYTVYTIETALHCYNISMYACIYCQGRLERYWNGLLSCSAKCGLGDGVGDGVGDTPQTVTTTRAPCGAKNPLFLGILQVKRFDKISRLAALFSNVSISVYQGYDSFFCHDFLKRNNCSIVNKILHRPVRT